MKKPFVLLALFLLLIAISLQLVYATSETITLSPMGPTIIRNVELQKDDHFVGSFTVTHLQTWQNIMGQTLSYSVSVMVRDPQGQVVLNYDHTTGDSFDYTAFYSGVYTISFSCGTTYLAPSGLENPQITINYNVVSGSHSILPSINLLDHTTLAIILIAIIAIVAISLSLYVQRKGKQVRNLQINP